MSLLAALDPVAAALAANGQAITAVRLATVIGADCAPLLALTVKSATCCLGSDVGSGITATACERPDNYRIALDPALPDALDAGFLEAAWALGAWDMARTERQPLPAGADPLAPQHGIAHLLHDPYEVRFLGRSAERLPCPVDALEWAVEAATRGWITWLCKPILYGPAIRAVWIAKDRSLRPDGGRDPRPRTWTAWEPVVRHADHQTIIRLGRAPHGNRGRAKEINGWDAP